MGGDSVLFASCTGGDSVLVNKKEWGGILSGGDFVRIPYYCCIAFNAKVVLWLFS